MISTGLMYILIVTASIVVMSGLSIYSIRKELRSLGAINREAMNKELVRTEQARKHISQMDDNIRLLKESMEALLNDSFKFDRTVLVEIQKGKSYFMTLNEYDASVHEVDDIINYFAGHGADIMVFRRDKDLKNIE